MLIHCRWLLGEGTKDAAILVHDLLNERHLPLELGIVGRQAIAAVRRLGQVERVALLHLEEGHRLLGQDEAGRRADRRNLQAQHGTLLCNNQYIDGARLTAICGTPCPTAREARRTGVLPADFWQSSPLPSLGTITKRPAKTPPF